MDAVFFGKKTNEAIMKIKFKDWWDTSEDSIIELLRAMNEELLQFDE
jgi:hypothetical protein